MDWFNCQVDDRSKLVGGVQRINTSEGYVITLSIESGLVYVHSMRIPTDHDLQNYPHVFFTSPDIWNTSVLDHGIPPSVLEDINQHSDASLLQDSISDAYGDPLLRDIQPLTSSFYDLPSLPPGEPITHVHLHDTKTSPNLRLNQPKGEDQPQDLTSDVFVYDRPNPNGSDNTPPMSIITFDDLLGRTFLLPMDGPLSEHVNDLCQEQVSREDQLRFKLKIDGDQLDDLISYKQLMEYLEDKTDTGPLEYGLYRFKCIKDHKGLYTSSDPEYNGGSYNLLIEGDPGEQTWEPYTCAVFAKEHNLLNTPGGKLLKKHARIARRLIVPRDYAHALQLDIHNGNNKWKEAIDLEIEQIKEYQVFKDSGKAVYDKKHITNAPKGHQKIRVHFVFDVKHCGKFKARLLADGHISKEPMETVYSGMSPITSNYGEQMLDMHTTFKHSQGRNFTLWVVLNIGMIKSLRYYIK